MEIILSDDCSSDGTFAVMCEMASAYEGPHRVRVVQNPRNLGVLGHALVRGREASGDIVVVAAGDDISEPQRAASVVDAFTSNPTAACVSSWVTGIDECGEVIATSRQPRITRPRIVKRPDRGHATAVIGCSAAYRKWVFDIPIGSGDYAEDMVFSFYIDLIGADSITIEQPLVRYRMHSGAATNVVPNPSNYEGINYRSALARIQFYDECKKVAEAVGRASVLDCDELDKARAVALNQIEWVDLSFAQRLRRVLASAYRSEWKMLAWGVLRLWGRFPNYQPILYVSRFRRKAS